MSRTVIVGAGVIGLACAYVLRRRGEEVVVVDRATPGGACSKGNAGWIVPSLAEPLPAPGLTGTSLRWMMSQDSPLHIDPRAVPQLAGWLWAFWRRCNSADYATGRAAWTRLTDHVLASFDALVADGVALEMHSSGLLFVYLQESAMRHALGEIAASRRPDVPPLQPLVGDQLRRFEPALRTEVKAGFWIPEERHVRPESLCAALLRRITQLGVEVHTGEGVTGGVLENRSLLAVRTARRDLSGDRFLIAAGAWSGLVCAAVAGVPLPVQAGKGYSVTVTSAERPFERPLYLGEALVGCSPFDGGYRYAGTMELSGINDQLIPRRVAAIRRSVGRYLRPPQPADDGLEWVGMRPLTPDGLPVIGRLPGLQNVFVASGHAMLGVTSALVTGTVIADLFERGQSAMDLSAFDPGRFVHS